MMLRKTERGKVRNQRIKNEKVVAEALRSILQEEIK